jgi:hypothetical protein
VRNISRLACGVVCLLAGPALALSCGIERVAVKNLADPQASIAYSALAKDMTVSDLAAMPPRPKSLLLKYDNQRFPEEHFRVWVPALVIGYKLEADGDYHVVIADPDDRRVTMVVEIPSPDCITLDLREQMAGLREKFDKEIGKPSTKYKKLPHAVAVSVEGILFRDFEHGQTGAAKSGTEIHPVLAIDRKPSQLPAHSAAAD